MNRGLIWRICTVSGALALASGCSEVGGRSISEPLTADERLSTQRMVVLERPPIVISQSTKQVASARRAVTRLSLDDLATRRGAREIDANALPFLSGTDVGRDFLASGPGRVLVRGTPVQSCPATIGRAPAPGETLADTAARALTTCHAALAGSSSPEGTECGCRLIALDSVLLVPREEMTYATGTTARLRVQSLDLDAMLVATNGAENGVLLRDVSGPVGKVERLENDRVRITLKDTEQTFEGSARRVGYRRGWLAERIYAISATGERLSLLIGFAPDELAELAGAWLAWPPDA